MKKLLTYFIERYCYEVIMSEIKPLIKNKDKFFDKFFSDKQTKSPNRKKLSTTTNIDRIIKELKERHKSSKSTSEKKSIKNNLELLEIAKLNPDKVKIN